MNEKVEEKAEEVLDLIKDFEMQVYSGYPIHKAVEKVFIILKYHIELIKEATSTSEQ